MFPLLLWQSRRLPCFPEWLLPRTGTPPPPCALAARIMRKSTFLAYPCAIRAVRLHAPGVRPGKQGVPGLRASHQFEPRVPHANPGSTNRQTDPVRLDAHAIPAVLLLICPSVLTGRLYRSLHAMPSRQILAKLVRSVRFLSVRGYVQ